MWANKCEKRKEIYIRKGGNKKKNGRKAGK